MIKTMALFLACACVIDITCNHAGATGWLVASAKHGIQALGELGPRAMNGTDR